MSDCEVLAGGCPQYFVMRYEASVNKETNEWQTCSQVGSLKLITDRIAEYTARPDEYRNIRFFGTVEEELIYE
jgi:hypothetical protein